jgi:hypothetical protein
MQARPLLTERRANTAHPAHFHPAPRVAAASAALRKIAVALVLRAIATVRFGSYRAKHAHRKTATSSPFLFLTQTPFALFP